MSTTGITNPPAYAREPGSSPSVGSLATGAAVPSAPSSATGASAGAPAGDPASQMTYWQQQYMQHWANPATQGQAKQDWDQYLKAAQAWQSSAAAGQSPNNVLPEGEDSNAGSHPGVDLLTDGGASSPSGASGASTGSGAADSGGAVPSSPSGASAGAEGSDSGGAVPSSPSGSSGAPSAASSEGESPSTPSTGSPSTPSGSSGAGSNAPPPSVHSSGGDKSADDPKVTGTKADSKDEPKASGQYPSPEDLKKYGPLKQDEPKLEPTKDSGPLSPGHGSFPSNVVYTPGSKEFVSLFTAAAKEAGVPASWATDPVLGQIVNHESGGQVGIPNYTYQTTATPSERWKEIREELLAGKNTAKPTPSPVNGAMTEGATNTGLGQLKLFRAKQFYPDGARGIGDAFNEAVGMLKYIKVYYGTPEGTMSKYHKSGFEGY
jgi:hypothetical protein